MRSPSNAERKFAAAIERLATGKGTIQTRLEAAYTSLADLSESDLPASVRDRWRAVSAPLATCAALPNDEARELANALLDILRQMLPVSEVIATRLVEPQRTRYLAREERERPSDAKTTIPVRRGLNKR